MYKYIDIYCVSPINFTSSLGAKFYYGNKFWGGEVLLDVVFNELDSFSHVM